MPSSCYGLSIVSLPDRELRCYGLRLESASPPEIELELDPNLTTFSCLGKTSLSSEALKYSGVAVELYSSPSVTTSPSLTTSTLQRSNIVLHRQVEILQSLATSPGAFLSRTCSRSWQVARRMATVAGRAKTLVVNSLFNF
jgi:hypothetical protein